MAALLHRLLFEVDCSKANLRQIPHTMALIAESAKRQSITKLVARYPAQWHAARGLDGTGSSASEMLFDHYVEHAKKKGVPRHSIETQLGMFLNKMVGGDLRRNKEAFKVFKGPHSFSQGSPFYVTRRGLCTD